MILCHYYHYCLFSTWVMEMPNSVFLECSATTSWVPAVGDGGRDLLLFRRVWWCILLLWWSEKWCHSVPITVGKRGPVQWYDVFYLGSDLCWLCWRRLLPLYTGGDTFLWCSDWEVLWCRYSIDMSTFCSTILCEALPMNGRGSTMMPDSEVRAITLLWWFVIQEAEYIFLITMLVIWWSIFYDVLMMILLLLLYAVYGEWYIGIEVLTTILVWWLVPLLAWYWWCRWWIRYIPWWYHYRWCVMFDGSSDCCDDVWPVDYSSFEEKHSYSLMILLLYSGWYVPYWLPDGLQRKVMENACVHCYLLWRRTLWYGNMPADDAAIFYQYAITFCCCSVLLMPVIRWANCYSRFSNVILPWWRYSVHFTISDVLPLPSFSWCCDFVVHCRGSDGDTLPTVGDDAVLLCWRKGILSFS